VSTKGVSVSFSGGKDSTAMLIQLLERGVEIDNIVFADTGFEFPELYEYIKSVGEYIDREITILKPEKDLFKKWFYGKITRGEKEGRVRGFPKIINPCWWTREAKIKPLDNMNKTADLIYVGIAYDEQERIKPSTKIKYPLNEWKWTEAKCVKFLNEIKLFNPLYVNFDRLGCFFCHKQSTKSLFVLWKLYPKLFDIMKYWDNENINLNLGSITIPDLNVIEKNFEEGKKPKRLPKYDCWNGCESVKKAFQFQQKGLGSFGDWGCRV